MPEWRYNRYRTGMSNPRLVDVFPDVDRTVIYQELRVWGIDPRNVAVEHALWGSLATQTVGKVKEGIIFIGPEFEPAYPTGEHKYIGLVHELAHLLQQVEGFVPEEEIQHKIMSVEEWSSSPTEKDAIRWSGKQAKAMGWSRQKFLKFISRRYAEYPSRSRDSILLTAKQEFGKLAGVRPMFRRPIRVRRYRRRR
mgnify:CR=1 FL=1